MFVRATAVAVTVSALLACPSMCVLDTPVAYGQRADCGCCSHGVFVDGYGGDGHPGEDRPDGGQQNCLCHGAVLGSFCRSAEKPPVVDWLLQANVVSAMGTEAIVPRSDFFYTHVTQFPSIRSGRDICALIGSRLL